MSGSVTTILMLLCVLLLLPLSSPLPFKHLLSNNCEFNAIYQLGDSISDTGNFIHETPIGVSSVFLNIPYGTTAFYHPNGRPSDGLLLTDYFAIALKIPFINPWLKKNSSFENGVNFAVTGATALSALALLNNNIRTLFTNSSLEVQVEWMNHYFQSNSIKGIKALEKSLFIVGEIGENDYSLALFASKTEEEVKNMGKDIVLTIKAAVEGVIQLGGSTIVVPGDYPAGCFPASLTVFSSTNSTDYDKFGCLEWRNGWSRYHNEILKKEMADLQLRHPKVKIIYLDLYTSFMSLLRHGDCYGFERDMMMKACCGSGGKYNFDLKATCGSSEEVSLCEERERRVNWDGSHLTQAANRYIASLLLGTLSQHLSCTFHVV